MINVIGKKVELNQSLKLTPKQLRRLQSLPENKQLDYILSILGKESQRITFDLNFFRQDPLAIKGKNDVLRRFQKLLDNSSSVNHAPLSRSKTSKWIGVEIECYINGCDPDEDSCDYCNGSGNETCYNCEGSGEITTYDHNGGGYHNTCNQCDGDGHIECGECDGSSGNNGSGEIRDALRRAKITNVSVRSDASLSSGGVEICLLFDASKGFGKLEKVCKILNNLGATINSDCGLHVHIDHKLETLQKVKKTARNVERVLPFLSKIMPPSRRGNRYCQLIASDSDRYSAINLCSHRKHGTIEYRLHSGSTNFEKIRNWIELLLCLESQLENKRLSNVVHTFQSFIDSVQLPEHLVCYLDKRYQKFNPSEALNPDLSSEDDDEEMGVDAAA